MSVFVARRPLWCVQVWQDRQDVLRCLALILVLAIILSASGACDTDDLGVIHRTSLWLTIAGLVVTQAVLLRRILRRLVSSNMLCSLIACGTTVVLTTIQLHLLKFTSFLPKEPDPPLEFLLFVLPLAGPVALLALTLVDDRSTNPLAASPEGSPVETAGAEADLWPEQAVLRVTAQDHYLELHTAQGPVLVRGRMKDAASRLGTEHGIQIHRSHWVAHDQIERLVRSGRDYRAILRDGSSLPVGRSRIAALRAFIRKA